MRPRCRNCWRAGRTDRSRITLARPRAITPPPQVTPRSSNCWGSVDLASLRALVNRKRGEIVREARKVVIAEGREERGHGRRVVAHLVLEVEHVARKVLETLTCEARDAAVAAEITEVTRNAGACIQRGLHGGQLGGIGLVLCPGPYLGGKILGKQFHIVWLQSLRERTHHLAFAQPALEILQLDIEVVVLLAREDGILGQGSGATFAMARETGLQRRLDRGELSIGCERVRGEKRERGEY